MEVKTTMEVQHPEGKLLLMDGSIIQGYTPEKVVETHIDNSLQLDTTGEYLTVGCKHTPVKGKCARETGRFFYEHAFFFLAHAREILADSRMFLAPVPVQNGIAYTGTSGFRLPTLGVYLEWWANCPESMFVKDGHKWLVWYIAGSPLSGSNKCGIVNEMGECKSEGVYPFIKLWPSFMKVNSRYSEAKQQYAAFTLEEVYAILSKDGNEQHVDSQYIDNFFLRSLNKLFGLKLQQFEEENRRLHSELTEARILLHLDEARELYKEYVTACEQCAIKREELQEQKRVWRAKLKAGELDNVTYQHTIAPINKELRDTPYPPFGEFDNKVRKKEWGLLLPDIQSYFENHPDKLEGR